MSEKFNVTVLVRQVRDGWSYNGYIKFDETSFFYTLDFTTHVDNIDEMLKSDEGVECIKRICRLRVKKSESVDATDITLQENIWRILAPIVLVTVLDFYSQPQTRDSNKGIMGMMVRGEGPLAKCGMAASIAFERSGRIDRDPALVEFLSQHA